MCLQKDAMMFTWKLLAEKEAVVFKKGPGWRLDVDCNLLYSNKICIPET